MARSARGCAFCTKPNRKPLQGYPGKWLLTISLNCFKENLSQRIRARNRTVPMDETFDHLRDSSAAHDERTVVLLRLQALLAALPVKADILQQGCCGMAGAFGFEAAKRSIAAAFSPR